MLLAHTDEPEKHLRTPSPDEPLRLLVSGCMLGWPCAVDGTDYGLGGCLDALLRQPAAKAVAFCPEDHGIGTPRNMPDITGGDGFDVLDGRARVLDEHGTDLTAKMLAGAEAMLAFALQNRVELAILTDMSAACGSQVISDGCRLVPDRKYQRGVGVATALLVRNGIPVVSQRDYRTLERLCKLLDPAFEPDPGAKDHHQKDWYLSYFGDAASGRT